MTERYDPKEAEPRLQKFWEQEKTYKFDENSKKTIFSIDTPPPYASADHLHVGHGMHYSQFEFVARYKRMKGFNVFFPMGYDDNGLPTERFVEKKHNVNKNKISRADFIKLCIEETKKCGKTYHDLFTSLGFSIDWDLLYQTIGSKATRVAQKSFIDLYKKGYLERIEQPTLWCVRCQTTIAQADLESVDKYSSFNDIKFKSGDEDLIISTTRPELIPACVAVFFNPDDSRYKHLIGKSVTVPLFEYEVPILTDESVELDKGTGLIMVCSFGDKEDIDKWHRYNLDLRIIFTENGRLNKLAGKFEGMKIQEARKEIIKELEVQNLLVNKKDISHAVNVHERCKTDIEFLKKKQWAIKVLDHKEDLLKIGSKVNWFPKFMKVRFDHWVKNLGWDWGISRQRDYGVPFPVWYDKKTGKVILPKEEDLPVDPRESAPKSMKGLELDPEMDVMDTWMTSSVTPQINANWGSSTQRKKFLPMSLRPQAHDIIRTWAFYTIVKSWFHHKDVPWKTIMISGHGQDPKGRKMSKSLGNFVVAQQVIEKYSADAFRFWAASVKLGEDLPYMEKDVITGHKTVTKLWNAARFCAMHFESLTSFERPAHLEKTDEWILSKVQQLVQDCTSAFEKYEYSKSRLEVENFFWNTFCDYYLEIVKNRLYNPDLRGEQAKLSAQYTLYYTLLNILKLMAPIMPHITEELYQRYYKGHIGEHSIHTSSWPTVDKNYINKDAEKLGELIMYTLSHARRAKSEKKVSLKEPIKQFFIKAKVSQDLFATVEEDIKAATASKKILFETLPETSEIDVACDIEL